MGHDCLRKESSRCSSRSSSSSTAITKRSFATCPNDMILAQESLVITDPEAIDLTSID